MKTLSGHTIYYSFAKNAKISILLCPGGDKNLMRLQLPPTILGQKMKKKQGVVNNKSHF